MNQLLLVEDTPSLQMIYASVLRKAGFDALTADTAHQGLTIFKSDSPPVALLDLMLPDRDGLELMEDCLRLRPDTKFIVITANGSINKAVRAMRAGAFEFLVKPFDEQRLLGAVANAFASLTPDTPASPVTKSSGFGQMVGSSAGMQAIYQKIESVSGSMASVFISGESGTGKELCAQAIHDLSSRANGPFVPLNCGAIPADLLESEVFGHLKGSFSGAIADKPGAATMANGGTLFLDEICEMDMNLQTKLLRFLQTSTIQPVGATRPQKVDARILCATNRDPLEQVRTGHFREDLYYRLHVVPIHMPPLRNRGKDVVEIAQNAIVTFSHQEGKSFRSLSLATEKLFLRLAWPGNVRQLLNTLWNAIVLYDGDEITPEMLNLDNNLDPTVPQNAAEPARRHGVQSLLGLTLAEIEKRVIEAAIERSDGSVTEAAKMLNIAPSTIYRKRDGWENTDT